MTKYSVFISSVYNSLHEERSYVIDAVLKMGFFPTAMEYVSFGNFEEIKRLIELSDAFLLILGSEYGSTDTDGVSWTEHEYMYAKERGLHIFAIETPSLTALRKKKAKTDEEKKQLRFVEKVGLESYLCPVNERFEYFERISTHFNSNSIKETGIGWVRKVDQKQWRAEHPWVDLNGEWFSFHVSNDDDTYIRVGTVLISQSLKSGEYRELNVKGTNYNCLYDQENKRIEDVVNKSTKWQADYEIYPDQQEMIDKIVGIFVASRNFDDKFADEVIRKGSKKGIHSFDRFESSDDGRIIVLFGTFCNVNSAKEGDIVLFRTKEARDNYLKMYYQYILDNNRKVIGG